MVSYQAQLNEFQGVENHIVHLRRYKAYHNNTDPLPNGSVAAPGDRIRLYFDYAPFRDLEVLRMRYRAWEKHLPELFIWHVFHSLALAVQLLKKVHGLNGTKAVATLQIFGRSHQRQTPSSTTSI
jgi:hypothetical protein